MANPDITIRPARATDAEALGKLGALLVDAHYAFDARRFMPPTPQTPHGYGAFLASQIDDDRVFVLVAEQNGTVIGYAYAGMEGRDYMALRGPAGALYDILVDPAYRQRGVARTLLEATIAELKSRGAPMVVLSTAAPNEAAQRLFESSGFRRTMIEMTRNFD